MKNHFRYTHLFTLLFLAAFAVGCSASSITNETESIIAEAATPLEAAPQIADNIFEIFEDRQGTLWFGATDKGVARYDGKTLEYLTEADGLRGNTVADIAEDKNGVLWLGTHHDMVKYDLDQAAKTGMDAFTTFPKTDGVPMLGWGWKNVITDRDGDIWVNTNQGIFQYDGSTFTEFKVPVNTKEMGGTCATPGPVSLDLHDSQGNRWFGTDGDGAYKYDGTSFTHYTKADGLPSNTVTSILEDKDGNLWFTCIQSLDTRNGDGGLCRYDGKSFTKFQEDGLIGNDIHTIYEDKSGNIWVGATGVGVYRYDDDGFTLFNEPAGINLVKGPNINGLQSMLEDSRGRLWLGFSGGLYRLEGKKMVNITTVGPWS